MKLIKNKTKSSVIALGVIALISLITFVMLAMLLQVEINPKTMTLLVFSVVMLFLVTLWFGVIQIWVFNDYKSLKKSLCAEGIFIIVLTCMMVITVFMFTTLQASNLMKGENLNMIDMRWFIGVFLLAYSVWKVFVTISAVKEKRFNAWLEVAMAALWLGLAVLTILSIFMPTNVIAWSINVCAWLVVAVTVVYMLISYIFKDPNYLEVEGLSDIVAKEEVIKQDRINRVNAMLGVGKTSEPVPQPKKQEEEKFGENLEEKLKQLDALLEMKVITQEEYDKKRQQIIEESF